MAKKKKTKEQIKQEIKTELLDELVIKELVLSHKEKLADVDQLAEEESQGFEKMFNKMFRNDAEQLAEFKTRDYYKAVTDTEYWANYYTKESQACDILLNRLNQIEELESVKRYADIIDFITSDTAPLFYVQSEEREKAQTTADGIIESYNYTDDVFRLYDELLNDFLVKYLSTAEQLRPSIAEGIIFNIGGVLLFGDLSKDDDLAEQDTAQAKEQRYLSELSDQLKPYWYAIKDIRNNAFVLLYADNGEEKKEPLIFSRLEKESNNIVPFKMPYLDILTVAETEMLSVITTKKFILDYNATKYSEEVINSLEDQDQEILDYITLTLYRNGYFYFTDRHIAVVMYKKTPTATVSEKMLEEINASLKRIQDINLPIGYISEEINRKGKRAKLERDSKLIWLDVVKYDYDTKSTVYRIVDRPPYYDYALQTGRLSTYNREIITRDIKGIQHDTKNTTLKQRFIRNIQALKQFSDVTMPITEVYNILAITDAHKYPNARKKSKEILDDLKNDFNFSYEFRRKNNKVTGIQFKKYTDRPLESEKN